MHYLTNTPLHNEALCIEAAQNTGFDIIFEPNPMPVSCKRFGSYSSEEEKIYAKLRDDLVGNYGCVVSYEGRKDHSPFWNEWDRLTNLGAAA